MRQWNSFSALQVQYHSKPVAGFNAQNSSEVVLVATQEKPASKNSNLMRGILRQGFLNPSPKEKGDSLSSLAVQDDGVVSGPSSVLDEAFKFGWD